MKAEDWTSEKKQIQIQLKFSYNLNYPRYNFHWMELTFSIQFHIFNRMKIYRVNWFRFSREFILFFQYTLLFVAGYINFNVFSTGLVHILQSTRLNIEILQFVVMMMMTMTMIKASAIKRYNGNDFTTSTRSGLMVLSPSIIKMSSFMLNKREKIMYIVFNISQPTSQLSQWMADVRDFSLNIEFSFCLLIGKEWSEIVEAEAMNEI